MMLLLLVIAGAAGADPALNQRIVQYCSDNLNRKVGNGQCAGLATQALRHAGARPRGQDAPARGDYVWGRQVYMLEGAPGGPQPSGDLANVQPGDIIQLRDVQWGPKRHAAHHTQVVQSVDLQAHTIAVYQQNAGGHQFVTQAVDPLDRLSSGWIRIYRPLR